MEKDKKAKTPPLILIVDDVETNRFILRDIITELGYLPMLAENGLQALKLVERRLPKLIILDVAMPEMDGYEFCRIMKESANTRDIPIIFISAFDDPADVVKGFNLGGADYVTKPFIPEVVKARVGLHLKLSKASKDMEEMNRKLQTSITEQLKQIELEKKNVIYALLRMMQESAGYDKAHAERLCYNAKTLAEAMQLSPLYDDIISDGYIETIELAAPLCDIGNIAIPTEILLKKEALTEEEKELVKKHTQTGAQILHDIYRSGDYNEVIQMLLNLVEYHHENWDGSGYPGKKKEMEIPLSAQIVALADAYCTLTEEKEGLTCQEALEVLAKDGGIKYNPNILNIMKKIMRQLR